MCGISDTITYCMKFFCAKEFCRSKNVVKAHERDKAAHKAFGDYVGINLAVMTIKNDGDNPTENLLTAVKALRTTVDASERAMRFICNSAQSILLISTINLLMEKALMIRQDRKNYRVDQFRATIAEQSCFDALISYLQKFEGL